MLTSVCKGENYVTSADEVPALSPFSFFFFCPSQRCHALAQIWLSESELANIMFKSSVDEFRALVGGRCSRRV